MGFLGRVLDLWRSRAGNFAVTAALCAPVLFGVVGGGVDLYIFDHHKSELQATADAAALAAASEAGLKGWSEASAKEVATSVIAGSLTNRFSGVTYAHQVTVEKVSRTITVDLSQDHYGYFFLGYFTGSPQIAVRSVARATGQATICIIAQAGIGKANLIVSNRSAVKAAGCSAYSNSTDPKGVIVRDTSTLSTQLACSAGGYVGKTSNYAPLPITDCPTISDPLRNRAKLIDAETSTKCNFTGVKLAGVKQILHPGVYCGGLEITEAAQIELKPGVYVMKDGRLRLDGSSTMQGDGVGFVFVGEKSTLDLRNDSVVALSAPATGAMAGLLVYGQVTSKTRRAFRIESRNAQKMIGTVYLPVDDLIVGGDRDGDGLCDPEVLADGTIVPPPPGAVCDSDLGAASAWPAIVANTVSVTAGSKLVLNSNYTGSGVPVPEGIGPNSSRVSLTR